MAFEDGCGAVVHGLLRRAGTRLRPFLAGVPAAVLAAVLPGSAQASMFKGETMDKVADVLAIVVLIIVPVIGIAIFWMVHVLPEKIAEKRHHPQVQAIQTLCLLSLVFGGLLWPIAWLWAYSKPVLYKMAYGTDKLDPHAGEAPGAHTEAPKEHAGAGGKGAA